MAVMKTMTRKTKNTTRIRTYSDILLLDTFEARYEYLKLDGKVGKDTFGIDRWLNQTFYKTDEWKKIRYDVINRDFGCDLAMRDYEIAGRIYVHHMNPITKEDVINRSRYLLDPEFLICTRKRTHDMIHFGNDGDSVYEPVIIRTPNDTCPWRRNVT